MMKYLGIIREERLRRGDERAIEGAAIFAGLENVLRAFGALSDSAAPWASISEPGGRGHRVVL